MTDTATLPKRAKIKEFGRTSMNVRVRIEGSHDAVRDAIREYESIYPPVGYDTRFDPPAETEGGKWLAYGSRYLSCD